MEKQLSEESLRHCQSFVNGGKCERSCTFPDVHECVSKCFPDAAGITSCASKLIHDTRTEMERHGIFHTEHVTDLERRESELNV